MYNDSSDAHRAISKLSSAISQLEQRIESLQYEHEKDIQNLESNLKREISSAYDELASRIRRIQ